MSTTTQNKSKSKKSAQGTNSVQNDDVFEKLMEHIEQIWELRGYYSDLKAKRDDLKEGIAGMMAAKEKIGEPMELYPKEPFPFDIIIRKTEGKKPATKIFKISRVQTVIGFSNYLLKEVEEVLEAFEKDIREYSKKLK